jgi:hypothetical protein
MSIYGEAEYGQDNEPEDPLHPRVKMPPPREPQKAQPEVGQSGHVDSHPSPLMGGENGPEEKPFLANPGRIARAGVESIDFNPSPLMGEDRRHESTLVDDAGINKAVEDNPAYRLPKMRPMPAGGNALVEHYLEQAITALGNSDKITANDMLLSAKTLVNMIKMQAEKMKDEITKRKMVDYLATCSKVEKAING